MSTSATASTSAASSIYTALLAVQHDMPAVVKNAKNPHFRNDYADLFAIVDAVMPVLNKHGVLLLQPTRITEAGALILETVLLHAASGSKVECDYPLSIPAAATPQQVGSALTYARRYALSALLSITPQAADDDGEAASLAAAESAGAAAKQCDPVTSPSADEAEAEEKLDKVYATGSRTLFEEWWHNNKQWVGKGQIENKCKAFSKKYPKEK